MNSGASHPFLEQDVINSSIHAQTAKKKVEEFKQFEFNEGHFQGDDVDNQIIGNGEQGFDRDDGSQWTKKGTKNGGQPRLSGKLKPAAFSGLISNIFIGKQAKILISKADKEKHNTKKLKGNKINKDGDRKRNHSATEKNSGSDHSMKKGAIDSSNSGSMVASTPKTTRKDDKQDPKKIVGSTKASFSNKVHPMPQEKRFEYQIAHNAIDEENSGGQDEFDF